MEVAATGAMFKAAPAAVAMFHAGSVSAVTLGVAATPNGLVSFIGTVPAADAMTAAGQDVLAAHPSDSMSPPHFAPSNADLGYVDSQGDGGLLEHAQKVISDWWQQLATVPGGDQVAAHMPEVSAASGCGVLPVRPVHTAAQIAEFERRLQHNQQLDEETERRRHERRLQQQAPDAGQCPDVAGLEHGVQEVGTACSASMFGWLRKQTGVKFSQCVVCDFSRTK